MAKRLFDIVFSALALGLLSPFLLAIGIWVRLDSPGPVFYRQVRVGRGRQPFRIFKFRTMFVDGELRGPAVTLRDDDRITRSGRFLRQYRLDELPQLLNVLSGDMSVVGPRPEIPRYVAHYSPSDVAIVLSVRPGITDTTSIEFRDEASLYAGATDPEQAYIERVLPLKIRGYRTYVAEQSFRGDLRIIWRTAIVVWGLGK